MQNTSYRAALWDSASNNNLPDPLRILHVSRACLSWELHQNSGNDQVNSDERSHTLWKALREELWRTDINFQSNSKKDKCSFPPAESSWFQIIKRSTVMCCWFIDSELEWLWWCTVRMVSRVLKSVNTWQKRQTSYQPFGRCVTFAVYGGQHPGKVAKTVVSGSDFPTFAFQSSQKLPFCCFQSWI